VLGCFIRFNLLYTVAKHSEDLKGNSQARDVASKLPRVGMRPSLLQVHSRVFGPMGKKHLSRGYSLSNPQQIES
jgi:hypothetical protein